MASLTVTAPRAVAMHGVSKDTIRRLADRIASNGGADTQDQLSALLNVPRHVLSQILHEPLFNALLEYRLHLLLHQDGKPLAVQTLLMAMRQADRWSDRIRAAEIILSRTTPAAQPSSAGDGDRDLGELSADELRQVVDQMQSELANRAQPVSAPDSAPKQIDLTPDAPNNPFE